MIEIIITGLLSLFLGIFIALFFGVGKHAKYSPIAQLFNVYKDDKSTENVDNRLMEEYKYLAKKSILMNKEIDEKLIELKRISDKIVLIDTPGIMLEEQYAQSLIREINHSTKTPIWAAKSAVQNMLSDSENLTETQKKKLDTITRNIVLVEMIIRGYRNMVMLAEDNVSETIEGFITAAIASCEQQYDKGIELDIQVEKQPHVDCGNNIVYVVLVPLLQNAYEAAPEKGKIAVQCKERDSHYCIQIENPCAETVSDTDLNKEGFTTRDGGGEGLRSVRRIAKTSGFDFTIHACDEGQKVIALLKIPVSKEEITSGK